MALTLDMMKSIKRIDAYMFYSPFWKGTQHWLGTSGRVQERPGNALERRDGHISSSFLITYTHPSMFLPKRTTTAPSLEPRPSVIEVFREVGGLPYTSTSSMPMIRKATGVARYDTTDGNSSG